LTSTEATHKVLLNDVGTGLSWARRVASQVDPAAKHAGFFQSIIAPRHARLARAMAPIDVDELVINDPAVLPDQEDPSIPEPLDDIAADKDPPRSHIRERVAENNARVQERIHLQRTLVDARIVRDLPIMEPVQINALPANIGEVVAGVDGIGYIAC